MRTASACGFFSDYSPSGGVLTPGAAFAKTNLIQNLNKTGLVVFEVVERQS